MSSFINGALFGVVFTIALVVIGAIVLGVYALIDYYFPWFFRWPE